MILCTHVFPATKKLDILVLLRPPFDIGNLCQAGIVGGVLTQWCAD